MTEENVIIDDKLMSFVINDSAQKQRTMYFVLLPLVAGLLIVMVWLGAKLAYLSTEVNFAIPAFVKPDKSVIHLIPVYRPNMSLSAVKNVAESYTTELLTLHFRQLTDQVQSRRNMFVDDQAFEQYYLVPLSGSVADKGSFDWIVGNNIIVSAVASPKTNPVCTNYFEENGRLRYFMKISAVQTFRGPSGVPTTRFVTVYMTLRDVPRAVNINGLQIETLGMRKA